MDIRRGFLRLGALSGAILSKRTRFILSSLVFCVLDSGCRSRVAEPHQMSEGWNSVKQLAPTLGLNATTFFLLDATASPACLIAATVLPVAFGGLAPWVPVAVVFSMFRWVLRCCQLRCWRRLCSCTPGFAQLPLAWRKLWRV